MPQATYQDAELLLKLYDMRREERLRAARAWFSANFHATTMAEVMEKFPPGSDHNAYYRQVSSYWEMAASFVAKGVLHEELFFENCTEMLFVWERIKLFAVELRAARKNPMFFKNMEKVAEKYGQWMNANSPGAYETFQAMVNPKK